MWSRILFAVVFMLCFVLGLCPSVIYAGDNKTGWYYEWVYYPSETIDANVLVRISDNISIRKTFNEMQAGTAMGFISGKIKVIGTLPLVKVFAASLNFAALGSGQGDFDPGLSLSFALPLDKPKSISLSPWVCWGNETQALDAGLAVNYKIPVTCTLRN